MSDYYSKFLGLFAKTRQNQSARLLGIESVFPDQEQIGEGVTTRSQAQIHPEPESSRSQAQTSPEPKSNANQHFDENDVEEEIEIETEKNPNESDVEKEKNKNERTKKIRPDSPILYDAETLIAQNDSLQAFVVKSHFKRQIRFK